MGKKKRGQPDIEELLARPWCYYCERDFDDLKILINHQKAKHFKCERCGRRLNTAGGLSVHMTQVHKETLSAIDNALANRSGLDVEIFGMEGIPEDIVTNHNQRVIALFAQAEAERRAASGNPGTAGAPGSGVKKPKLESPSDLKKRLAEHKAKKAAEQAALGGSGDNAPDTAGNGHQSPNLGQSPTAFQAGSPGYPPTSMHYGAAPNASTYPAFPQPYTQQPSSFPQQPPGFSSPNGPSFSNSQSYPPPPQFQLSAAQTFPPQFQNATHQPYNSSTSPVPFQHNQFQVPQSNTPPQNPTGRQGSLPAAPGLPQRPSFGAPPVNAFQMQQMHQGQIPGSSNSQENSLSQQSGGSQSYSYPTGNAPSTGPGTSGAPGLGMANNALSTSATTLDDLVSGAAKDADEAQRNNLRKPDVKPEDPREEKKGKREKEKNTRLVYSDNEISPEEKMARMPRYAFDPTKVMPGALGDTVTAAVLATPG